MFRTPNGQTHDRDRWLLHGMGSKRDLEGFKPLEGAAKPPPGARHALPFAYLGEALARLGAIRKVGCVTTETPTESGRRLPGYSLGRLHGTAWENVFAHKATSAEMKGAASEAGVVGGGIIKTLASTAGTVGVELRRGCAQRAGSLD